MAGSAPGGPHSSPSSIRQSLTPSALLSPPILIFAGSLRVSPLLSLLHTQTHTQQNGKYHNFLERSNGESQFSTSKSEGNEPKG